MYYQNQRAEMLRQKAMEDEQAKRQQWDTFRQNLPERNDTYQRSIGFIPTRLQEQFIRNAGGDVQRGLSDYQQQDALEREKLGLPPKYGVNDALNRRIRPLGGAPGIPRIPDAIVQRIGHIDRATSMGLSPEALTQRDLQEQAQRFGLDAQRLQNERFSTETGEIAPNALAQRNLMGSQGVLYEGQGAAARGQGTLYEGQANVANTNADLMRRAAQTWGNRQLPADPGISPMPQQGGDPILPPGYTSPNNPPPVPASVQSALIRQQTQRESSQADADLRMKLSDRSFAGKEWERLNKILNPYSGASDEEKQAAREQMAIISKMHPDIFQTSGGGGNIPTPKTKAEYDALPSGTVYIDPQSGKQAKKR